jgi:hypothetical protein
MMTAEMLEVKRQLLKLRREEFASFEKERLARIQEIERLKQEVGESDTALIELKEYILQAEAEDNVN